MYEIPFRRLKSFWGSTEKHTPFSFHLISLLGVELMGPYKTIRFQESQWNVKQP